MSQAAPYSYISFSQLKQQLANRLYDPTKTFWADAELGVYAVGALRTWNALTGTQYSVLANVFTTESQATEKARRCGLTVFEVVPFEREEAVNLSELVF